MERVRHEGERMHRITDNDLEKEEVRVDDQEDHNPLRPCEPHFAILPKTAAVERV